jgi:hypothetical protein
VVETSPHSLSVRYGGVGKLSSREGPVYQFFQRSHCKVLDWAEKSAHTNSTLNGLATPLAGAMRS